MYVQRCRWRNIQAAEMCHVPEEWHFFVTKYLPEKGFYCQDTIHILAKLRTKLITASNLLVLGTETACLAHLQYLINNVSKNKHVRFWKQTQCEVLMQKINRTSRVLPLL